MLSAMKDVTHRADATQDAQHNQQTEADMWRNRRQQSSDCWQAKKTSNYPLGTEPLG